MPVKTLEASGSRDDVVRGGIQESAFSADLAQVLRGEAPDDTRIPAWFFANTHSTQGLKTLLHNVDLRLGGGGGEVSCVFRLPHMGAARATR